MTDKVQGIRRPFSAPAQISLLLVLPISLLDVLSAVRPPCTSPQQGHLLVLADQSQSQVRVAPDSLLQLNRVFLDQSRCFILFFPTPTALYSQLPD